MELIGVLLLVVSLVIILAVAILAVRSVSRSAPEGEGDNRPTKKEQTILETMEHLRGLNFEVEVAIDPDGEIIGEYTQYHPLHTEHTDEEIVYLRGIDGLTMIHNHDTDTPPSVQDLLYAGNIQLAQMIVVTPSYNYFVSPGKNGWSTGEELNDVVNKYLHLFKVVSTSPGGLIEIASTDQAIENVARDLGYTYFWNTNTSGGVI